MPLVILRCGERGSILFLCSGLGFLVSYVNGLVDFTKLGIFPVPYSFCLGGTGWSQRAGLDTSFLPHGRLKLTGVAYFPSPRSVRF